MRELVEGKKPLLKNQEILNMSVEEWGSVLGDQAAQLAKKLAQDGVTTEELKMWRTSRKDILVEIPDARFDKLRSGERESNERS